MKHMTQASLPPRRLSVAPMLDYSNIKNKNKIIKFLWNLINSWCQYGAIRHHESRSKKHDKCHNAGRSYRFDLNLICLKSIMYTYIVKKI
nr:MAG TPA: hypothetical protein [Caudoviricetes sp.]DAT21630.1 MAG TPA: hypothetical protein [Caudoviricetes sp.]